MGASNQRMGATPIALRRYRIVSCATGCVVASVKAGSAYEALTRWGSECDELVGRYLVRWDGGGTFRAERNYEAERLARKVAS